MECLPFLCPCCGKSVCVCVQCYVLEFSGNVQADHHRGGGGGLLVLVIINPPEMFPVPRRDAPVSSSLQ